MIDYCKICGNSGFRFLFEGKDRLYHLPGNFNLYQCMNCGLIQIDPMLTEQDLARYYSENYCCYEELPCVDVPRSIAKKILYCLSHPVQTINDILYAILLGYDCHQSAGPASRVLDIGCGAGQYLIEKRKIGCSCFGVDINATALDRLRKRDQSIMTHCGNVWEANYPDNFFDIIHICHVLEHVREPDKLLVETRRILKKDGLVYIEVPNVLSLNFALFGKYWLPLDTPRHVYAFSIKNLKIFFSKLGFEIIHVRTFENSFSIVGNIVYLFNAVLKQKTELMKLKWLWNQEILKLFLFPYIFFISLLGVGDIVAFDLRKADDEEA